MTKFDKKLGRPRPKRKPRSRIVEPDFDAAIEHAVSVLDEVSCRTADSEDKRPLHHSVKVLRAVITASERDDAARMWS